MLGLIAADVQVSELDPIWYRRMLGYVAQAHHSSAPHSTAHCAQYPYARYLFKTSICALSQDPVLFNASLRDNLAYGTLATQDPTLTLSLAIQDPTLTLTLATHDLTLTLSLAT